MRKKSVDKVYNYHDETIFKDYDKEINRLNLSNIKNSVKEVYVYPHQRLNKE